MTKLIEGKDYELVNAGDVFDDDNEGYIYGIDWLDEFGNVNDCQWFKTEKERQECINKANFYIICQESWETVGYATQMDERVIELIYNKLKGK